MKTFQVTFLFWCLYGLPVLHLTGQSSVSNTSTESIFKKAQLAYDERAYQSTLQLLDEYERAGGTGPKSQLLRGLATSYLNEQEGRRFLTSFVNTQPDNTLTGMANFRLGVLSLETKDYPAALQYFRKINAPEAESEAALFYYMGYCKWQEKDATALEDFEKVRQLNEEFTLEATYYSGSVLSDQKKYDQALQVLLPLDENEENPLKDPTIELIANIYYQTGNYEGLISYASKKLTDDRNQSNQTLSRLLGEVYFSQEKYRNAARHFQKYLDLSKQKIEGEAYFKLALSYFNTGDDAKAIQYFKLSGLDKGDLAQLSNFYLGQLYQKSGNANYAISAFQTAYLSGPDAGLAEEALFLSGKLCVTTGDFPEAIQKLTEYKASFAGGRYTYEADELLTKAYLSTSDYEVALEHIEKTGLGSATQKSAYQKVTLLKGQQLFNDSRFEEAVTYFKKSVSVPVDNELASQGHYLMGECYSILKNSNAEKSLLEAHRLSKFTWGVAAAYGLGYLYYNEKKYELSEKWFSFYLNSSKATDPFYLDAKVRLADLMYVGKKYEIAIDSYTQLSSSPKVQQDYITYQLGLCYLLTDKFDKAKNNLQRVASLSNSTYSDDALLQLGQLAVSRAQWQEGITWFDRIIRDFPQSNLVPYAYSNRALCHSNLGENEKAREDYEFILDQFIQSSVAGNALLGLQELQKRGVKVSRFENHMAAYTQAHPDDSSLELISFESAKAKYFSGDYPGAIESMVRFLDKNPKSPVMMEARYYLADSYLRLEQWQLAASAFEPVTAATNAYQARAFDKRGKALMQLSEWKLAISNYRGLIRMASNQKETYIAREGLMLAHFQAGKSDSSFHYADQILGDSWKPLNASEQAWLIKGKIYIGQSNYQAATDELLMVINGPKDATGAEAKYLLARIFFDQGAYNRSLETLFDLNRNYASYPLWLGRSFLLVSDNYLKMNELLQAKATLNSIIDHSPLPEIKEAARLKLAEITEMENQVLIKSDSVK